jgi:hypothetical protein
MDEGKICSKCKEKDDLIQEMRQVLEWIYEEDKDWRARDMVKSVLKCSAKTVRVRSGVVKAKVVSP